jgi:hypothetical protein
LDPQADRSGESPPAVDALIGEILRKVPEARGEPGNGTTWHEVGSSNSDLNDMYGDRK